METPPLTAALESLRISVEGLQRPQITGRHPRRPLTGVPASGRMPVRLLASCARILAEAACGRATRWPGLVPQRLVRPGVENQRLQLGTMYQRDDLTQHDQVIAGAV